MSLKKRIHSIESELFKSEVWDDSSEWLWIRKSGNNHKGFIGERITDLWAEYANVLVEPRVSPEHDRIINYLKHEIKLGTLTNDLKFKFGHIKMSYDWNILTLIGVWPHDIKMWQVPKANVEELFYSGHMIPYKKGREDDILTFNAHKIPDSIAMHEIFLLSSDPSKLQLATLLTTMSSTYNRLGDQWTQTNNMSNAKKQS